nr:hypothetical protein [Tanacetum cinerariifolium]
PRTVRPTQECTYKDYLNCGPLKFNGTKGVIGLTRWFKRTKSVSNISNCTAENQMMTAKYFPRGEVKKLEVKLWNLKVKGTYITSYTLCFQELVLLCERMFPKELDEIERYVGGIPEMIRENAVILEMTLSSTLKASGNSLICRCGPLVVVVVVVVIVVGVSRSASTISGYMASLLAVGAFRMTWSIMVEVAFRVHRFGSSVWFLFSRSCSIGQCNIVVPSEWLLVLLVP